MNSLNPRRSANVQRLERLRGAMHQHAVDALIVPSSDPHLSEYLPEHWQARQWLTGFTGSAGTLVVTRAAAGLWVDARYWEQADAQLAGTGIESMKVASAAGTAHLEWLAAQLPAASVVAIDGSVFSLAAAEAVQQLLEPRGIEVRTDLDLVAEIWDERPELPAAAVFEHAVAPVARADKLASLRAALRAAGAQWHWISTLDDLAWLANLRGADVPYNPVFLGHALIGLEEATLFVAPEKVPPALAAKLAADGIELRPYTAIEQALAALPATSVVLLDPRRVTHALRHALSPDVRVIEQINPSTLVKSRKTEAELAHIRYAMDNDGAALAEFFCWLEGALGHETITELTIDERVTAARARRPGFVGPSFATIAGFNANGALPHYRATEDAHATLCMRGQVGNGLLLIDSGGQYEHGTTDITRVVPIGQTTPEQRRDYTLVLKGMIQLSMAHFPRGTRAPLLDALARAPLWAAGADYGHGTGHGVGYFLNVHEGPQGISPHLPPEPHTAMQAGMVTSNEPGLYRPGRWGVRIENLLANVPAETTECGEFLRFETLTMCPIDTRLIARALLAEDEVAWLNAYHATVRERVGPHLRGAARDWLDHRTAPLM